VFPDHYAVPGSLDIRLVGYVRHGWDNHGHYVTTLWCDSNRRFFYFEDFWTPYTPPFWLGTSLDDLTPCDPDQFCTHVEEICEGVQDWEEQMSVYYQFTELLTLWGVLEGVDRGFAWVKDHPRQT
jgi:hypothetical protein